ncbi:hypothetical protein SAY86_001080 [Trapa natans]|uniref:MAPK kinase substrate protein At1g80180-like n=1 Tax=Trapa natans TaxID=22666 RepID=A0AAN7RG57_TRANT|nr:hypothetical protein SAY86_001080 [Trapa natans]
MEGLPRSAVSFRRQGSSGLVWDDKFLSGELNKINQKDQQPEHKVEDGDAKVKPISTVGYKAGKGAAGVEDPPSPRVSACGFCSAFKKPSAPAKNSRPRARKGKRSAR